ncbi:cyclin-dependent kinase inhibitor 2c [Anaeramoeba ignava]|uniref:Cyclin-dependent kinase inhibitor 2c n=1 Tax=Anaeramoeba ignava TaxID=1746090 RepID=A0A9Q0LH69_ANAIG|nr:cyclin-dependent kinase inhibitor 2c [Anaeramoeba ignava]
MNIWEIIKQNNLQALLQIDSITESNLILHFAIAKKASKKMIELLITKGADINAKTDKDETPLHFALSIYSKEVIEYLITNGADINAKTKQNKTTLHFACQYNSKVIEYLITKWT